MADTSQCLSAKPVCSDGSQVLKSLELRSGESFAKNRQVVFLDP